MRHRRQRGLPRPTGVPGDRGRLLPGRVGRRTRSGVRCGRHRRCRFVQADLTRDIATQLDGPYDLLVDFGTLGDLRPDGRRAMAANVRHLCRPDSELLLWCFYVSRDELPRISSRGPSRLSPGLEPGEEVQLFGDAFDIETVHAHRDGLPIACFLLTYRGPRAGAAPAQDG